MSPTVTEIAYLRPEGWGRALRDEPGLVLLRSGGPAGAWSRYSYLGVRPVLTLRSHRLRSELDEGDRTQVLHGSPWVWIERLYARFELPPGRATPFPLGGAFGCWGYDLGHFLEPRGARTAVNDLEFPDCWIGFYPSLIVFDHREGRSWIVATGMDAEGATGANLVKQQTEEWQRRGARAERAVGQAPLAGAGSPSPRPGRGPVRAEAGQDRAARWAEAGVVSNRTGGQYREAVRRALDYIRAGDIYQVNLAHRLSAPWEAEPWALYEALAEASPAPFSGYLNTGEWALASASPELFLRLESRSIVTRPIKGTRPRGAAAREDARLAEELRRSPKEQAELTMITDLLRNDLGRVCEYGSVRVPVRRRLERYPQVHHLVSTIRGRLRPEVSHASALAQCFPGGSVTGAPKIRAMEIIEQLEPVTRGPYTGCLGYLGFNRRSQWNLLIRTALWRPGRAWYSVGAGIVADSEPEAEWQETLDKGAGFARAVARAELRPNGSGGRKPKR